MINPTETQVKVLKAIDEVCASTWEMRAWRDYAWYGEAVHYKEQFLADLERCEKAIVALRHSFPKEL